MFNTSPGSVSCEIENPAAAEQNACMSPINVVKAHYYVSTNRKFNAELFCSIDLYSETFRSMDLLQSQNWSRIHVA